MMPEAKILIVEDNEINIRIAQLFLKECGYDDVLIARNGKEALAMFSEEISLVLLDIGLPDISGTLVCKKIRKRLKEKSLPIIAYTATGDLESEKLHQAGIDDYLVKPTMLKDFKLMIERYLH